MSDWTESDMTALRAAIKSGALTVTYDGPPRRSITYQSLDAMRSLLAEMRRDVTAAAGGSPRRYVQFRKGFDSC